MFEKEAEEFERRKHYRYEDNDYCGDIADGIIQAYQQGAEFGYNKAFVEADKNLKAIVTDFNKENAELQEKISVLLSCKNCPENKGGWICAKEYENKCLPQKIVYIKELKKENAQLKAFRRDCIKLTEDNAVMAKQRGEIMAQLAKAKETIKEMLSILPKENIEGAYEITEEAEEFLKESK